MVRASLHTFTLLKRTTTHTLFPYQAQAENIIQPIEIEPSRMLLLSRQASPHDGAYHEESCWHCDPDLLDLRDPEDKCAAMILLNALEDEMMQTEISVADQEVCARMTHLTPGCYNSHLSVSGRWE